MSEKPLAIDLFCGLGGWTEGLLAEGWRVRGYDIEAHEYGDERYPAELVLADVMYPLTAEQEAALLAALMGWSMTPDQVDVLGKLATDLSDRHDFRQANKQKGLAG